MEGITLRILMLAWTGTVVFALPVLEGERRYHGLTSHEERDLIDQDLGLSYGDMQPLSLRHGRYERSNVDSASGQFADEFNDRGIETMLNTPLLKHQTQMENEVVKRSFQHVENQEGSTKRRRRSLTYDPTRLLAAEKKRRSIKNAVDAKANGQQSEQHYQPPSPEAVRAWKEGKRGQVSERDCIPQSPEALKVWAEGKRALVDQLREQMKDDSSAVEDESSAVGSVQKCLQSAVAAGLEARQQTKIITLLAKNSAVLIGHIDIVEGVATEELAGTGERLEKFQKKLENIRSRIVEVEKELECGNGRSQNRNRRISEKVDKSNGDESSEDESKGDKSNEDESKEDESNEDESKGDEPKEQVPLDEATDNVDAPLSKMQRAATEIADMLSKAGSKHRQSQGAVDRVKRDDRLVGNEAQQVWIRGKRALGNEAQQVRVSGNEAQQVWVRGKRALGNEAEQVRVSDNEAQQVWVRGKRALGNEAEHVRGEDNEAQQVWVRGKRALGNEAQQVWVEGKRALVEQLKEQLKEDGAAVDDEGSAVNSVQKCLQSAVAAGLEARQQSKIIKLLAKNSGEMIGHIDIVEGVASDELGSTGSRLSKFETKLQEIRDRIAAAEQDLRETHGCGQGKPGSHHKRRSEDVFKEQLPLENVAVHKRHAGFNTGISQKTSKLRQHKKQ